MVLTIAKMMIAAAILGLAVACFLGEKMNLFDPWEEFDIPQLPTQYMKRAERKTYNTTERMILPDATLFFGRKTDKYTGPINLDQPAKAFTLNTVENSFNFLPNQRDDLQYAFTARSRMIDNMVYSVVIGSNPADHLDKDFQLYNIQVPSGRFEPRSMPALSDDADPIYHYEPLFIDQRHGYLLPDQRSIFFETYDGGHTWTERHLPTGYTRLDHFNRYILKSFIHQPTTNDIFLSGYFPAEGEKPGYSPIYRLSADNTGTQGWREVARLEGYAIRSLRFLNNGDLLILAFEGERPERGSDSRSAQVLRWDGEDFEHLHDFGVFTLFRPQRNTNLDQEYFVTGPGGLVVINGRSFKNERGDLPVYNVSYVSHDYGRSWERLNNGTATGPVWFDGTSGYLYRDLPFSTSRRRP
ncbi:hypothetical protein DYI26_09000 [Halomonas litopenaei]|nr:hypothetical protein [Halomonas litopenaei]